MTCGSALSSLGRVEYFSLEAPETSRPSAFAPAIDGVRRAASLLSDGGTAGASACVSISIGS